MGKKHLTSRGGTALRRSLAVLLTLAMVLTGWNVPVGQNVKKAEAAESEYYYPIEISSIVYKFKVTAFTAENPIEAKIRIKKSNWDSVESSAFAISADASCTERIDLTTPITSFVNMGEIFYTDEANEKKATIRWESVTFNDKYVLDYSDHEWPCVIPQLYNGNWGYNGIDIFSDNNSNPKVYANEQVSENGGDIYFSDGIYFRKETSDLYNLSRRSIKREVAPQIKCIKKIDFTYSASGINASNETKLNGTEWYMGEKTIDQNGSGTLSIEPYLDTFHAFLQLKCGNNESASVEITSIVFTDMDNVTYTINKSFTLTKTNDEVYNWYGNNVASLAYDPTEVAGNDENGNSFYLTKGDQSANIPMRFVVIPQRSLSSVSEKIQSIQYNYTIDESAQDKEFGIVSIGEGWNKQYTDLGNPYKSGDASDKVYSTTLNNLNFDSFLYVGECYTGFDEKENYIKPNTNYITFKSFVINGKYTFDVDTNNSLAGIYDGYIGQNNAEVYDSEFAQISGVGAGADRVLALKTYEFDNAGAYTVTLDAGEYGENSSLTVLAGTEIGELLAPTVTNPTREFAGWYYDLEDKANSKVNSADVPHKNITVYADYLKTKDKVTFDITDTYGAITEEDAEGLTDSYCYVNKGDTVTLPNVDAEKGYKFRGWYPGTLADPTDAEIAAEDLKAAGAAYTPEEDVTLTAVFEKLKKLTLSIDTEKGTLPADTDTEYYISKDDEKQTVTLPVVSAAPGHVFRGWYKGTPTGEVLDADLINKDNTEAEYTLEEADVKLTAVFEDQVKVTLSIKAEYGALPADTVTSYYVSKADNNVTLPEVTAKPGYRFRGWYKGALEDPLSETVTDEALLAGSKKATADADTVFTAVFERLVEVTYDYTDLEEVANGYYTKGDAKETKYVAYVSKTETGLDALEGLPAARADAVGGKAYGLLGWYTADGKEYVSTAGAGTLAGDTWKVTLHAKYGQAHVVTLSVDSSLAEASEESFNVAIGNPIREQDLAALTVTMKAGTKKVFDRWTLDAAGTKEIDYTKVLEDDTTIYAQFRNYVTVTFDAGKKEDGTARTLKDGAKAVVKVYLEETEAADGVSVKLAKLPEPEVAATEKIAFVGWKTSDGTAVEDGFAPAEDTVLTADYNSVFTITFKIEEGKGTLAKTSVNVAEGAKVDLDAPEVDATKYEFIYWYKDGDETKKEVAAKGYTPTADITLMAFIRDRYQIEFVPGADGAFKEETETGLRYVTQGKKLAEADVPEVVGKAADGTEATFAGWFTDEELTKALDLTADITAGMKVYAKYAKKYTVTFVMGEGGTFKDDAEAAQKQVTVPEGKAIPSAPEIEAKSGYTFDGWYAGDKKLTDVTAYVPESGVTLTAKFTKKEAEQGTPSPSPSASAAAGTSAPKPEKTEPAATGTPEPEASEPADSTQEPAVNTTDPQTTEPASDVTPADGTVAPGQPAAPADSTGAGAAAAPAGTAAAATQEAVTATKKPSTGTKATDVSKLIKISIKSGAKVKATKVITIKAAKGIKTVTLNGKKVDAKKFKKTVKTYRLFLKKNKKLLKKKGMKNKLVVTDKKKNKVSITFTIK